MRSLNFFIAIILLTSVEEVFSQILTPNKHDNPAEKNFAAHIALSYTSNNHVQYYSFESGCTYSNKWFGLHLKYELSAADMFRKKVESKGRFKAIPDFNTRLEFGGGINLYSREGSATCFTQLASSESDGIIKELWGVGNGNATVYGQIRGGVGFINVTNVTDAIYSQPQFNPTVGLWDLRSDSEAYVFVKTPFFFIGWCKVKKFEKDCGNNRVGLHKLYFDFLFGKPEIAAVFDESGNEKYNGYYPLMTYARGGWRIGYEAIRMNAFSSYMSLEAGYYPGLREAMFEDGLVFVTMRFGFSSGPFKAED